MRSLHHSIIAFALLSGIALPPAVGHASTAAYGGRVIEVSDCYRAKQCLLRFTVQIDYLDYISWSKFGPHTKAGEATITRQVRSQGTAAVLNGRLTNADTLAKAFRPGAWGYFYEDTWHNLHTTPDFQWGEVVRHEPDSRTLQLRIHPTHKDFHLESNPPRVVELTYQPGTDFRIEAERATPETALSPGHWVQVHRPRPPYILVRTEAATFNPSELLPHQEGRRGYANDLTAPAILTAFHTENPQGVIDVRGTLSASRHMDGEWNKVDLNCNSVSFVLDGKLAPVEIAVKPGRHAVLCHYRSGKTPHKVFVQSQSAAGNFGTLKAIDGKSLTLETESRSAATQVELTDETIIHLDGRISDSAALEPGRVLTYLPARGATIIAFPPNRETPDK